MQARSNTDDGVAMFMFVYFGPSVGQISTNLEVKYTKHAYLHVIHDTLTRSVEWRDRSSLEF